MSNVQQFLDIKLRHIKYGKLVNLSKLRDIWNKETVYENDNI